LIYKELGEFALQQEDEVRNEIDGEVLAKLHIVYTNVWEDYETEISIPDGVQPLYFTFRGQGNASLKSFALLKEA